MTVPHATTRSAVLRCKFGHERCSLRNIPACGRRRIWMYGTRGRDGSRFGNLRVLYGVAVGGRAVRSAFSSFSPLLPLLSTTLSISSSSSSLETIPTNLYPWTSNSDEMRIPSQIDTKVATPSSTPTRIERETQSSRRHCARGIQPVQSSPVSSAFGWRACLSSCPRAEMGCLISGGFRRVWRRPLGSCVAVWCGVVCHWAQRE
jgi:hypothetical protein